MGLDGQPTVESVLQNYERRAAHFKHHAGKMFEALLDLGSYMNELEFAGSVGSVGAVPDDVRRGARHTALQCLALADSLAQMMRLQHGIGGQFAIAFAAWAKREQSPLTHEKIEAFFEAFTAEGALGNNDAEHDGA